MQDGKGYSEPWEHRRSLTDRYYRTKTVFWPPNTHSKSKRHSFPSRFEMGTHSQETAASMRYFIKCHIGSFPNMSYFLYQAVECSLYWMSILRLLFFPHPHFPLWFHTRLYTIAFLSFSCDCQVCAFISAHLTNLQDF